jgi:hypothetical protein
MLVEVKTPAGEIRLAGWSLIRMTNPEIRMAKQARITNDKAPRSHAPSGNAVPRRSASRKVDRDIRCATRFTFVIRHSSLFRHSSFVIRHCLCILFLSLFFTTPAQAQQKVHLLHAGKMPPGAIGAQQLQRGGPLAGYFQPIQVKAPTGALVSLAIDQQFSVPQRTPLTVGMLVAAVYRLRVTEIPNHVGEEVYPTVEVINRIYPPVGEEFRFPIPIELTQAELEMALAGKFVTRVVYLEEPQRALPVARTPESEQSYFEVRPTDDPLEVADRLGRPVAILRLGGRLPDATGPDARFLYGSPPVLIPNSLDLYSEPVADHAGAENPIVGNSAKKPQVSTPADLAQARRDEQGKVVLAAAAVEVDKPEVPSATSTADRAAVPETKRSAHPAPVVKVAPPKRIQDPVWQSNKPAPVSVSISDDE